MRVAGSEATGTADIGTDAPGPTAISSKGRVATRLAVWRSPADQPGWARPMLLTIAGLAGFSYAWGVSNFPLEPFYAAAVRSMGANWSDFFFGAVDPRGTVSLDKLPGAFWVQALFVRVLGFHYWVVALPQVIAGVLTILVLYRLVRRLAGPKAGLVAALIMAASPVTALLNRGNVSDPLFVLLVVLSADATVHALTTGRLRTLLLAGLWIGLAFQTKMLQAWLVAPALLATYLVAARPGLARRWANAALAGVVMVVVSLSWMTVVMAVPAHDRPFVDGTTDNSTYVQVFVYNGWSRLGISADRSLLPPRGQPFLLASVEAHPDVGTQRIRPAPDRLLVGPFGRDDAWLLPVALLSAVGVLISRRAKPRHDLLRAGIILWGSWLVILGVVFSKTDPLNSYYTASLVPAIAALCAIGLAVSWRTRLTSRASRIVLLAAVPATTVYAVYLVPAGSGVAWWVLPLAGAVGLVAEGALAASLRGPPARRPLRVDVAIAVAALSVLLVPALTTAVVVLDGLGSFSTPYQSAAANSGTTASLEEYQSQGAEVAASFYGFPPGKIVQGVDTSAVAAPLIMVTGKEFLPIGGYLGSDPVPTLGQLRHLVSSGQVRLFVVPLRPAGPDPRTRWIRENCLRYYSHHDPGGVVMGYFDCSQRPGHRATG